MQTLSGAPHEPFVNARHGKRNRTQLGFLGSPVLADLDGNDGGRLEIVAASMDGLPYDRWRELGADGVIVGTVQRASTGIRVELRLYNIRARQQIYGREYTGAAANPRNHPRISAASAWAACLTASSYRASRCGMSA